MDSFFTGIEGCRGIEEKEKATASWFGAPFVCDSASLKRNLVSHLEDNRIQTRNYFAGNLLLQPAYRRFGNWKDYPNATQVLNKVFFVGVSPTISEQMLDYVEKIVKSFPK